MGDSVLERGSVRAVVGPAAAPATLPGFERMFAEGACRGRLLVVEDCPDIRALYERVLQNEGYLVRTAGDGVECLKLAATMRPDLILLNYLMPRMDGLEALRALRKNCVVSYLKVVMYSAVSNFRDFQREALAEGALECLHAPFRKEVLLEAVERALRRK